MARDIQRFVRECEVCQRNKYEAMNSAGLLQPLQPPHLIWMEISFLKGLFNCISSFLSLYSRENFTPEPVTEYYQKIEAMLKLLKPVLECVVDLEVIPDELLRKESENFCQLVDDIQELFDTWHPLLSKICFVLDIESLLSKSRTSGLKILALLKLNHQSFPAEFSLESLELCMEKFKSMGCEERSDMMKEAVRDEAEGADYLLKIADSLNLKSNQELLIESVSLEKLKETAEQAENNAEADYIDKIIALVIRIHEHYMTIKQSQRSSPIPIPPDLCCPLSLELMTDPVIVGSGQTYERAYIKEWIDLGLTVCPMTRQTLSRTNLTPNYTVKALIASWCELNNVKLPDPVRATDSNECSPLRSRVESVSPLHPRSSSDGSLPTVAGNGHASDIGRASLLSSGELLGDSEEQGVGSSRQPALSPSRNEFGATGADDDSFQGHKRTSSALGRLSNADHSLPGSSRPAVDSSDAIPDPPAASQLREPEFPQQLDMRPRTKSLWGRPNRFIPRIVPSLSVEIRVDRSSIETQVQKLVDDLRITSIDTQREATAELRLLAKYNMDNRIVIANCGAIDMLISLLRSEDLSTQENAVTALLNLSINDNNKTLIAAAGAIEPLIHVLEAGTPEAKENSAATLFSLSVMEDNKVMIGRSGAIGPLVDLLGNGTPRGKKDAASALYNLSISHENKARILEAGAVKHLMELMDPAAGMVDKAVVVLANLATIPEGRIKIGQEQGIPSLVEVVELGSARGKEHAAAALLQLCKHSSKFCNAVLQEGAVPPLVSLSQSGTPRAKEKAQLLFNCFRNQRHSNGGRG